MDSKVINRVLTVIFLVLTVFFFYLYKKELKSKSQLPQEFIDEAVLNLENSGIDILNGVISSDIPNKNIYSFETENTDKRVDVISTLISDKIYDNNVTTARFDTPEGISVGIYSGAEKSEIAKIVFNQNDSSFKFIKNNINISGTEQPFLNDRQDLLNEEQIMVINEICKSLSQESNLGYRISGCSGDETFFVATAVQNIDGHDCSDVFMNFVFEKGELVAIFGRWIVDAVKSKYNNTLIDGINALYELDLKQVSCFTQQKISYKLKNTDSSKYFLIPVWEISYVDINNVNKTEYIESI